MPDTQTQIIDPARPWIVDHRDAPADLNWAQTLLNPMGESSKVHFGRAWTFMFMGRVILFFAPVFGAFILGLAGMDTGGLWKPLPQLGLPMPALLLPFFLFMIVTEFTSFVAHRRRLANARRPAWLSSLVLLPLILALAGFVAGASGGAAQYDAMKAKQNQPQVASSETDGTEAATDNDTGSTEAETTGDDNTTAEAEEASDASAQNNRGQGQRGRRAGPPPTQKQMAVGAGMGLATPIWMLVSFIIMMWTLLYVMRLPNDGVGKIQTGSVEPGA